MFRKRDYVRSRTPTFLHSVFKAKKVLYYLQVVIVTGCLLQRTPGLLSGLEVVLLELSTQWFILWYETLTHFGSSALSLAWNTREQDQSVSPHLIYDRLWNRFLARSPTYFLSFFLSNSLRMTCVYPGEGAFTLPSEAQQRAGIKRWHPGR